MPERYDALLCVWNKCGIIKNEDWSDEKTIQPPLSLGIKEVEIKKYSLFSGYMKTEIPYARRIGSHIKMSYFLYCFATSYMPVTFGSLSLNQKSLACCDEGSQICV
jgi:hypothetical protein